MRALVTVNLGGVTCEFSSVCEEMAVMVPSSDGCPPPCGWKIVASVMTTWSSSVPCLKSARLESSNEAKGRTAWMVVRRVCWVEVWNVRIVRAMAVVGEADFGERISDG